MHSHYEVEVKKLFILMSLLLLDPVWAGPLRSFTTDYCTGYLEGNLGNPRQWKHCCLEHDLYFWAGGSKSDRDWVDLELKHCVENTGAPIQARLIYNAVRLGGISPFKLPSKKWSNGWKANREFRKLTLDDIEAIEEEILNGHDFVPLSTKENFLNQLRSR